MLGAWLACQELNTSEAWFDAKEDLNQPEPAKEKPHSTNDNSDETEGKCKSTLFHNLEKNIYLYH